MSDVIALLDLLGGGQPVEIDVALAELDPQISSAIRAGDSQTLANLLGGRSNMVCGLFPAKEKDEEKEGDEDDAPVKEPKPSDIRRAA